MAWEVEFTDEFAQWWEGLSLKEQTSLDAVVDLLEERGTGLKFPHSSQIEGLSKSDRALVALRELRFQCQGRPFRVLYAFDPLRCAILLLGGDKTGQDRWYEINIPIAIRLYREHLNELKNQGKISE